MLFSKFVFSFPVSPVSSEKFVPTVELPNGPLEEMPAIEDARLV